MKIISGGQTGADRAGLDAAIACGVEYGGAVPLGRLAEDGPLDGKYRGMDELETPHYPTRTEKNVLDGDATLAFTMEGMGEGTAYTIELTRRYGKPCLHLDLEKYGESEAVGLIRGWLEEVKPEVLNVAGSRESTSPGIYKRALKILTTVFKTEDEERGSGNRELIW